MFLVRSMIVCLFEGLVFCLVRHLYFAFVGFDDGRAWIALDWLE